MRVTVLASGSAGNATLVTAGGTRILVDAGIAPGTVEARMRAVFGQTLALDGIVLTHPHGDHASKAEACARHFDVPIYLTEPTRRSLGLGRGVRTRVYGPRGPFDVQAIRVEPMAIPHDAPQVALVLAHHGLRAGIVTDLGHVPRGLAAHLSGCQLLLLESNHDPAQLWASDYPTFLKQRIASPRGHLSNAQAGELLRRLDRETVEVVLVHLSRTCNQRGLALELAGRALRHRAGVVAADQDEPLDRPVRPRGVPFRRRPHEAQLLLPL
ncbi:MAG: MBL fold metallo-hydrolase [Sandaracinaceae bacterium]